MFDSMGWWPFKRRTENFENDPHVRSTKMWIQDLREVCERSFDDRSAGQNRVKGVQADWRKSHADGELGDSQLEGLERRAKLLLDADDSGWKRVLDDEEFWKAGWGSTMER